MARRPTERKVYAHAKPRRLRRVHGMNQVEMARALGISTSYADQIEQGRRPLTAPVLLRPAGPAGDRPAIAPDRRTYVPYPVEGRRPSEEGHRPVPEAGGTPA